MLSTQLAFSLHMTRANGIIVFYIVLHHKILHNSDIYVSTTRAKHSTKMSYVFLMFFVSKFKKKAYTVNSTAYKKY